MRLILASASPRRAELLRAAGFVFEVLPVDLDERVHPGEIPEDYVRRLAAEKSAGAQALLLAGTPDHAARPERTSTGPAPRDSEGAPGRGPEAVVVLGADTVVVVDGEILGKPRDDRAACSMLRRLSGRTHRVLTGISLRTGMREAGGVEATTVEFSALADADLDWYLASGEGRDKAGAYAIQGLAARFIPRIQGSYSNVVGLPIAAVQEHLAELASGP